MFIENKSILVYQSKTYAITDDIKMIVKKTVVKMNDKTLRPHLYLLIYLFFKAACAAAILAIGTLNGEQLT